MSPSFRAAALCSIMLCGVPTLSGCGDEGGIGTRCIHNEDCNSGFCHGYPGTGRICTEPCVPGEPDSCPRDLVCAVLPSGDGLCATPCTEVVVDTYVACIDGVPVHCSHAGSEGHCSACGCASEQFCCDGPGCMAPGECEAQLEQGEPCSSSDWCISRNCGVPASGSDSICLVENGAPCTADNCALCDTSGGGSYCIGRTCSSQAACPEDRTCALYSGTAYCVLSCTFSPGICAEDFSCIGDLTQVCWPDNG
jgi:hypothetical protein